MYTGGSVGCVRGLIYHGYLRKNNKQDRMYQQRKQILVEHDYSPESDLEVNEDGVYEVTNPALSKDIMAYFEYRKEDSRGVEFSFNVNNRVTPIFFD